MHKYPFIRLLIPLAGGIATGEFLASYPIKAGNLFTGIIVFFSLTLACYPIRNYSFRWVYGGLVHLLLFSTGILLFFLEYRNTCYTWDIRKNFYSAVIYENPVEKENTILCRAEVELQDSLVSTKKIKRKILLYLEKDSNSLLLLPGDRVVFYGKIGQPASQRIPEAFNYPRYLLYQSINGTAFVPSRMWKLKEGSHSYPVKRKLFLLRKEIVDLYRKNGFTGDELAIVTALSIGYKDILSPALKESYAVTGGGHFLALSGLHINIYCLFFSFLLSFRRRYGKGVLIKKVILLLFLWLFAFMAGATPSIIRAVIMFSLASLAPLQRNKQITLNILAATAFLMLIHHPFVLFNISFQLSFTAVAAILLLSPLMHKTPFRKGPGGVIINLIGVTLAAQLGTLPFTLHYFSRFPVYFILTNLAAILPVTLILYGSFIFLISIPFPVIQSFIAYLLTQLLSCTNSMIRSIGELPFSSLEGIRISGKELCVLYLILILLFCYLSGKRRLLLPALTLCCLLTGWKYYHYSKEPVTSTILFYGIKNHPAIHFIDHKGHSYLVANEAVSTLEKVGPSLSNYWSKSRISLPEAIGFDYRDKNIYADKNIIHFRGTTCCFMDSDQWSGYKSATPLKIDYLYITKGYNRLLSELLSVFTIHTVILDTSLPEHRRKRLKEECGELGIQFHCLQEKGYLEIPVKPTIFC